MDKELMEKCLLTDMRIEGLWANEHLKQDVIVDSLEETEDSEAVKTIIEVQLQEAYPIIRKAVAEEIKKWGNEDCPHNWKWDRVNIPYYTHKKRECDKCWQDFWRGIE